MLDSLTLQDAKARLDKIIAKSRVDLYKPIQIAEVLYHSRNEAGLNVLDLASYRVRSRHWRDTVSREILGKVSTSSIRFQDNVWEANAMYPQLLALLDEENKRTGGSVERYIYLQFQKRQTTVASLIALLEVATVDEFKLADLLTRFEATPGIKRSIDKAYEIVVFSLLETLIVSLAAKVTVEVAASKAELVRKFSDLTKILLGIDAANLRYSTDAHVYRVGVTNAADRGLDMWANFGPAIQVKHINLDANDAEKIANQIESDALMIVCRTAQRAIINNFLSQIGWGNRVKGIITQEDLIDWYERCLRGNYRDTLAQPLLHRLLDEFKREFKSASSADFLERRGYSQLEAVPHLWEVSL